MLLGNRTKRSKTSSPSVGENDIEVPFLFLDSCVKAVQVGEIRDITLHAENRATESFNRRIKFRLSPPCDDDIGAFAEKALSGGETETGGSTGNKSDFIVEFSHNDWFSYFGFIVSFKV